MNKKLLLSLLAIFTTAFLYGQTGWTNLTTGYTGHFNDVHFINADTGYSVGSTGDIIITKNGGASGVLVNVSTSSLNSVVFLNDSTGFVVGNNGKIYKTQNYGANWTQKTISTTANLNSIFFVNDSLGFVAGAGGVFFQTNDTGNTWSNNVISGITNNINDVYFTTTTNGYAVGSSSFNGFISRTTSTGAYWQTPSSTIAPMNDIAFTTATNGFAVGESGAIYKTTNGSNWSYVLPSPSGQNLNAIQFVNSNVGYIVGDSGTVLKTVNGGTSWVLQPTPILSHLYALSVVTENVVYAGGYLGTAIKTNSGGNYLTISVPDYNVYCKGYTNLTTTTNYNGTGTLSYTWSNSSYLSATNIASPTAGPLMSNTMFYVTVTDGVLSASDSSKVSVVALNPDSICIVTVGDSSTSNLIVFEKHVSGPIDFYKIYRESSVANIFDSIGFIPADSAGVFNDTASNPAIQAYAYRISSVDSCGNESLMSSKHTTMHLNINAGVGTTWNLLWSPYIGINIPKYRIWRGSTSANLQLIDSVPGTSISYTDLTPPVGLLFYQVEIMSPYTCKPYDYKANTNYNSSRSNTANNGYIAPNPVNTDFTATPTSGNYPLNVSFNDLSGGNPTYWLWSFGDGATSNLENPSHTYTTIGLFTVKLVSWNSTSKDSTEKVNYINAHNVGIETILNENDIRLFPNPSKTNQVVTVSTNKTYFSEIEIFDIIGKQLIKTTLKPSNKAEISTSSLPSGVYFIQIKTLNGQIVKKKLIVE